MALHSLGSVVIATPGTPARVTNNQSVPTHRLPAHSFLIEALSTNVGKVYIGTSNMNKTTLLGVCAILAIPTTNILPSFSATVAFSASAFNLADYFIDTDNTNDGALISYIVA